MIRYKYPKTLHLPWSLGITSDDKVIPTVFPFENKRVICTKKMDGESCTIYSDGYMHARSIDGHNHESQDWVKGNIASIVALQLNPGWRICGENLYARHSIAYNNLSTFFMVYSIWNKDNEALSWDETKEYCEILGLKTVPILYDGIWDQKIIKKLWDDISFTDEGYVVRLADSFTFDKFSESVAKFVRQDHVQTDEHWKNSWIPNKLSI